MQEDTSFQGDVIGLCISIKGRHTEGKGSAPKGVKFQHSILLLLVKMASKTVTWSINLPSVVFSTINVHSFISLQR